MKNNRKKTLGALTTLIGVGALAINTLWADKEMRDTGKSEVQGSLKIGKVPEAEYPGLARISLEEAFKAATGHVPGIVFSTELERRNGSLVYQVEVVSPNKVVSEITVDAGNGKVLAKKIDQPDQDGEEDEKDIDDENEG